MRPYEFRYKFVQLFCYLLNVHTFAGDFSDEPNFNIVS